MIPSAARCSLPTSSRWGGTLVGVYANERDARYNLLDTIFSTTDEGVLSLAAIRDASGQPSDFQIVHLNQGAARLLEQPSIVQAATCCACQT